jgi:hypothetical protein
VSKIIFTNLFAPKAVHTKSHKTLGVTSYKDNKFGCDYLLSHQ